MRISKALLLAAVSVALVAACSSGESEEATPLVGDTPDSVPMGNWGADEPTDPAAKPKKAGAKKKATAKKKAGAVEGGADSPGELGEAMIEAFIDGDVSAFWWFLPPEARKGKDQAAYTACLDRERYSSTTEITGSWETLAEYDEDGTHYVQGRIILHHPNGSTFDETDEIPVVLVGGKWYGQLEEDDPDVCLEQA